MSGGKCEGICALYCTFPLQETKILPGLHCRPIDAESYGQIFYTGIHLLPPEHRLLLWSNGAWVGRVGRAIVHVPRYTYIARRAFRASP